MRTARALTFVGACCLFAALFMPWYAGAPFSTVLGVNTTEQELAKGSAQVVLPDDDAWAFFAALDIGLALLAMAAVLVASIVWTRRARIGLGGISLVGAGAIVYRLFEPPDAIVGTYFNDDVATVSTGPRAGAILALGACLLMAASSALSPYKGRPRRGRPSPRRSA